MACQETLELHFLGSHPRFGEPAESIVQPGPGLQLYSAEQGCAKMVEASLPGKHSLLQSWRLQRCCRVVESQSKYQTAAWSPLHWYPQQICNGLTFVSPSNQEVGTPFAADTLQLMQELQLLSL